MDIRPMREQFNRMFDEAEKMFAELSFQQEDALDTVNHESVVRETDRLPIDPWQGREVFMRCSSCMYFAPKEEDKGRCRRRAPTMNGYPVVYVVDWCGDHKLT